MSPEKAEEWIRRREAEAASRGLDRHAEGFWRPAWDWIAVTSQAVTLSERYSG